MKANPWYPLEEAPPSSKPSFLIKLFYFLEIQ
jgi:hypothetical protein